MDEPSLFMRIGISLYVIKAIFLSCCFSTCQAASLTLFLVWLHSFLVDYVSILCFWSFFGLLNFLFLIFISLLIIESMCGSVFACGSFFLYVQASAEWGIILQKSSNFLLQVSHICSTVQSVCWAISLNIELVNFSVLSFADSGDGLG